MTAATALELGRSPLAGIACAAAFMGCSIAGRAYQRRDAAAKVAIVTGGSRALLCGRPFSCEKRPKKLSSARARPPRPRTVVLRTVRLLGDAGRARLDRLQRSPQHGLL